ncbi:hypothetical protein [Candidatus Merdisoma sp. JLR.KK006]|uniref:hypothetical protein n=1 Tax=Candidatus Merdisoma sp. JLR.KK006 TaxID=3112626 RepID=UPI002FF19736
MTHLYLNTSLCGNRGYQKDLKQRRLEKRQNRVCKVCGKTFTPKRSVGCGLLLQCLPPAGVSPERYG